MPDGRLRQQIDNLLTEGVRIRKAGIPKTAQRFAETDNHWLAGYGPERGYVEPHRYTEYDDASLEQWRSDIKMLVAAAVPKDHHCRTDALTLDKLRAEKLLDAGTTLLRSIKQSIELGLLILPDAPSELSDSEPALEIIEQICSRFAHVVRQLGRRHDGRATLEVDDEYDVQDLLHALLLVDFDDVRAEEWTPSTAGASARMDLFLKKHRIAIETKMMRKGLSDRKLTEELLVDIGLFPAHSDCGQLVIFIYDPAQRIVNPAALRDIEGRGSIPVHLFFSPGR